jgi:hypothetical protein
MAKELMSICTTNRGGFFSFIYFLKIGCRWGQVGGSDQLPASNLVMLVWRGARSDPQMAGDRRGFLDGSGSWNDYAPNGVNYRQMEDAGNQALRNFLA